MPQGDRNRRSVRTEPFVFEPLDSTRRQIRVLCLAPGMRGDPLRGSFELVSLDKKNPARYETISYAWGDAGKNQPVILSGKLIMVPINTAAALRRMRRPTRIQRLWIDAVCIDQTNTDERSQQVALMGNIYSRSRGNLIHLTDDEAAGRRMVQLVQKMDGKIRGETDDYRTFRDVVYHESGLHRIRGRNLSDGDLLALQEMYQLPWFRRLWVIQEARLAPSNTCIFGASVCQLSTLLRVSTWCEYELVHSGTNDMAQMLDCYLQLFNATDHELGWYAWKGRSSLSLSDLLFTAQSFEKSEPRDGVFAILGMLPESDRDILPDYSKSIASIMSDTTRAVLLRDMSLSFLRHVSPRSLDLESGDGSSWMFRADRQIDWKKDPIRLVEAVQSASTGLSDELIYLNPSGHDAALLRLEGVIVDEVQFVTRPCWPETFYNDFHGWLGGAMTAVLCHAATDGPLQHIPRPELMQKLSHTVVCGLDVSGQPPSSEDIAVVQRYLEFLLEVEACSTGRAETNGLWNAMDAVQELFLLTKVQIRRLFVTKFGQFGLGLAAIRAGDKVVVLRGGEVPFILRPVDEQYQFVGAAYVYGIMQGEAVNAHLANGGQEQVFTIR